MIKPPTDEGIEDKNVHSTSLTGGSTRVTGLQRRPSVERWISDKERSVAFEQQSALRSIVVSTRRSDICLLSGRHHLKDPWDADCCLSVGLHLF